MSWVEIAIESTDTIYYFLLGSNSDKLSLHFHCLISSTYYIETFPNSHIWFNHSSKRTGHWWLIVLKQYHSLTTIILTFVCLHAITCLLKCIHRSKSETSAAHIDPKPGLSLKLSFSLSLTASTQVVGCHTLIAWFSTQLQQMKICCAIHKAL